MEGEKFVVTDKTQKSRGSENESGNGREKARGNYQRPQTKLPESRGTRDQQERKRYPNRSEEERIHKSYSGSRNQSQNGFREKSYSSSSRINKDEEQLKKRNEPRRLSADKENRLKDPLPDKMEIINRLEKEKKVIHRKEEEKRKQVKASKPVIRPKRSNNIDWTREYENDSYDDDDIDLYLI